MSECIKLIGPKSVEQHSVLTLILTWSSLFLRMALSFDIYYFMFFDMVSTYASHSVIFFLRFFGWLLISVCYGIVSTCSSVVIFAFWCYKILSTKSTTKSYRKRTYGRNMHRKMIFRGIRYLPRFDQRFLIFSFLQVSPAWAAYHQSACSWFCTVLTHNMDRAQKLETYVCKLSNIRDYIFPRETWTLVGLTGISFLLMTLIISVGIRKQLIFGKQFFLRTHRNTNKNKSSHLKVRTPFRYIKRKDKLRNNKKQYGIRKSVFTSVQRVAFLESEDFDGDSTDFDVGGTWCVLDNSANSHIWNKEADFVPGSIKKLGELSSVATIGGTNFYPAGIGDLNIRIRDDENKTSTLVLKNVLYFPNSPVNIISVVCLADHFNDDTGTWVQTCRNSSKFTWDNGKFMKELKHSTNRLPEITVNEGINKSTNLKIRNLPAAEAFCTYNTILPEDCYDSNTAILNADNLAALVSNRDLNKNPKLENLKETEYREMVKKRLLNGEFFKIGDTVRYCKDGHFEYATYVDFDLENLASVPKYVLDLHDSKRTVRADKEYVTPIDVPDICDIHLSEKQVKGIFQDLSAEELKTIFNRGNEDKLFTEFMAWHERLNHLPKAEMFQLCERGELPSKFLALKDKTIICPSCVIGNMKKKPWRYKGSYKGIRKEDENYSGSCVSVDQLVSKQPGLVPRQDGKHSLDRITGATVYHDNHSGWTYSHLQTSLDGEQTLASKVAFEKKAATYDVPIKSYHADNGRFAEKSFKDAVTDANQTIK